MMYNQNNELIRVLHKENVNMAWSQSWGIDRFKDIDKDLPVASFSSKKLTDMGFQFKYNLKGLLILPKVRPAKQWRIQNFDNVYRVHHYL